MQRILPEITNHGSSLITISPELPDLSLSLVEKENLEFEVLSDIGNETASDFGLVFTLPETLRPIYESFGIDLQKVNGDDSFTLPIPATYVIDGSGNIVYDFLDVDYTKRQEPEEILEALEKL